MLLICVEKKSVKADNKNASDTGMILVIYCDRKKVKKMPLSPGLNFLWNALA